MNEVLHTQTATKKGLTRAFSNKKLAELGYVQPESIVDLQDESYVVFTAPIGCKVCICFKNVKNSNLTEEIALETVSNAILSELEEFEFPILYAHQNIILIFAKNKVSKCYKSAKKAETDFILPMVDFGFITQEPETAIFFIDRVCVQILNKQASRIGLQLDLSLEEARLNYFRKRDYLESLSVQLPRLKAGMEKEKMLLKPLLNGTKPLSAIDLQNIAIRREKLVHYKIAFDQLIQESI